MSGPADGDTWDPLIEDEAPEAPDRASKPSSERPTLARWEPAFGPLGRHDLVSPDSPTGNPTASGRGKLESRGRRVGARGTGPRPERGRAPERRSSPPVPSPTSPPAPRTPARSRQGLRNPLRPSALDAPAPVAPAPAPPRQRPPSPAPRAPYPRRESAAWLAWTAFALLIIVLGALGLNWANDHGGVRERFYDPIRSIPQVREVPDGVPVTSLQITPPGQVVTVESEARNWELRAAQVNWEADGEAAWAGLTVPPKDTHWISVVMDVQDRAGTELGPWVDFTFQFAGEDGRQFAETQCWEHCLATAESVEGRYVGYLFFLVPDSVPDAGYIIVTPLVGHDNPFALRLESAE